MRPGIVGPAQRGQRAAALRRCRPSSRGRVLAHVPVLPLDRRLAIPMVHADDVADAVARALEGRVPGAFNLAATPAVTADLIAVALGARLVHVPVRGPPGGGVGELARPRAAPRSRLDRHGLRPAPPRLRTRARRSSAGRPRTTPSRCWTRRSRACRTGRRAPPPVLRPRTVAASLVRAVRQGPVSSPAHAVTPARHPVGRGQRDAAVAGGAMADDSPIPADQLPPGSVRRSGPWAVGNRDGELFAVSRRCRHQLGDLSEGTDRRRRVPRVPVAPGEVRRHAPARWSRDRAGSSATTARRRATPSSCSATARCSGCASLARCGAAPSIVVERARS